MTDILFKLKGYKMSIYYFSYAFTTVLLLSLCAFLWRLCTLREKSLKEKNIRFQDLESTSSLESYQIKEQAQKIERLNHILEDEKGKHAHTTKEFVTLQTEHATKVAQNHQQQDAINNISAQLEKERQEAQTLLSKNFQIEKQLVQEFTKSAEQEKNFLQMKQSLESEFKNLAHKIFEEKTKQFTHSSNQSIEGLLQPFRDQIKAFQSRVNEIHTETVKENATMNSEIQKVMNIGIQMSQEADHLAQALKGNKKTIGNWGEMQLEKTLQLAGLVKDTHYQKEVVFKDNEGKTKRLDFVINLPENKHLILDSKVSLVDYEKAIAAENEEEMHRHLDNHVKAVKQHIISLSEKNYANLKGIESPSFVLMFMPIEPAYTAALQHSDALFHYGYERNIILVSHTTLLPIIRTVANIWIMEQSNKETKEIADKAGEIFNNVCIVGERLSKIGGTLETLSTQYNQTVKAMTGKQGLYGKVDRFDKLSSKVMKKAPTLDPIHLDIDHDRLAFIEKKEEQSLETFS